MVGVYRSLALSSSPPDYDQVLSALLLALADANEHLGGDVLHPLRDLVSAELTIVELLLKAQIGMSQYQFKETMVALTASKQKILSWMSVFSTNSTSTSKVGHNISYGGTELAQAYLIVETCPGRDSLVPPLPFLSIEQGFTLLL